MVNLVMISAESYNSVPTELNVIHQGSLLFELSLSACQLVDRNLCQNVQLSLLDPVPDMSQQSILSLGTGSGNSALPTIGLGQRPLQDFKNACKREVLRLSVQGISSLCTTMTHYQAGLLHRVQHLLEKTCRNACRAIVLA